MKKLYLLFLTLLCALPGMAQDLYLVGDMAGDTPTEQYKFTKQADGSYTLTLTELTGSFKIYHGTESFGFGGPTKLAVDQKVRIQKNGAAMTMNAPIIKGAKLTVTDLTSRTAYLTVTGTPEYTGPVYMYGTYADYNWESGAFTELTADPSHKGVYTINNVEFKADANAGDGMAHFYFGNNADLYAAKVITYGATSANQAVKVFEQTLFQAESSNEYTIAPGRYNVRFDFNTNSIEVDYIPTALSIVGTLGLNGQIGTLNPTEGIAMTLENGKFVAKSVIIGGVGTTGVGSFFFVEKNGTDWNATGYQFGPENNNTMVTPGTAVAITRTKGQPAYSVAQGIYDITVDPATMTVTLSKVNYPIIDMTAIGTTGNYVNTNPGAVSQFIIRVGDELYGHSTKELIGKPFTLEKLTTGAIPYISMTIALNPQGNSLVSNYMLFYASETKTFIAVEKALTITEKKAPQPTKINMTYDAAKGTFEATVPYISGMVIGNAVNDMINYGAPITVASEGVYSLTAEKFNYGGTEGYSTFITNMAPFQNKVVEFNPLAMTLTVLRDGDVKPEINTMYCHAGTVVQLLKEEESNVFTGVLKFANGQKIAFLENQSWTMGTGFGMGVVPVTSGNLVIGEPVSVKYSPSTGYVAATPFTFTGETGYYTVKVNLDNMTVTVTNLPNVATFAELEKAQGGYFTGTATCEFNYAGDKNAQTLYLKNGEIALQFSMTEMNTAGNDAAGFDLSLMAPHSFNRGNTITGFRAALHNGVYVITEFTTENFQSGKDLVRAPIIGKAENTEIATVTSIDDAMLNTMVQVQGTVTINENEQVIVVGNQTIQLVNTFTKPYDGGVAPAGEDVPMMAEGTPGIDWQYGSALPKYSEQKMYVAGLVTKDASDNLALNMTATSEGVITGVESLEIDADTIVDVYNMQGIVVRRAVKFGEATIDLPAGLYIIAGQKVMIRK